MTTLAGDAADIVGADELSTLRPIALVETWLTAGTAALALAVWALPVTHGSGGRDSWVVALGLLSLLPGLVAVRPWRRLPGWQVAVAMAPSLAAVVVCLTAPTGFDGLDRIAATAYAGALFLLVRAWVAGSAVRRHLVLTGLVLVGLEQFTQAYLPWWGSGSVRTLMVGTFYWHDQFAAFMLGTGLVAGVMAVRGEGPMRIAGWLVAPWCFTALLFAGSRAALATFVVCWLLVLARSYCDRKGRAASFGLLGLSLALATVLTSPVLMADSGWFTSTVQAREAAQSTEGNGMARLAFWRAAIQLGEHHPLTGAGFHSFGGAGSARMPAASGLSIYVHNGYLQAFSDGGLVLLLALLLATALPLLAGLRLLSRRRSPEPGDVSRTAVPVALLALVLHAGVDFDWEYPALLALLAVLAALLPTGELARRSVLTPDRRLLRLVTGAMVLLVVVAAVPAALRASGLRSPAERAPVWAAPVTAVVPLHGRVDWLPAASVCRAELDAASASLRAHALACSAAAAADDPELELMRDRAMVLNGDSAAGLARARAVVARYEPTRPMVNVSYAGVLAVAGRPLRAREVLVNLERDLRSRGLMVELKYVRTLLSSDRPA